MKPNGNSGRQRPTDSARRASNLILYALTGSIQQQDNDASTERVFDDDDGAADSHQAQRVDSHCGSWPLSVNKPNMELVMLPKAGGYRVSTNLWSRDKPTDT